MQPMVTTLDHASIDITKVPPLEGKLIGKTFYEAMQRFYAIPENVRRFEEWRQKRKETQTA